jgi:thioesterase domain-containing protein
MYGPTETTIWSLIHRVCRGVENETGAVPVGRPIANTKAYILDDQRQLLPVAVPGELFLGGVGLAKGYRGQPLKTADRFISVESVGGIRLYRTGDVAVRRDDGSIEVIGRTDNQVKVRGCRIELEAVEAAVLLHPKVAAAAARAWREPTGDFRLSVYIVAANDDGAPLPNLAEMRAFLYRTLPDSMIPSDLIELPAIPLTPHGKVDRSRLAAPTPREVPLPQTTLCSAEEKRMALIWREVLGLKHVGLDDDFFDLGGHSLLIAALQQRIAAEFGLCIPIVELFHNPTIRQQAELTQRLTKDSHGLPPGVLALQPPGPRNNIFWVYCSSGSLAKAIGGHQPFLMVALTAEDVTLLGEDPTLESIATRHVRKILATQSEGPYTIGGLCAGGILAYEIASQLRASGHEMSLLVLLDAPNPSYLESDDSLTRKLKYMRYLPKRAAQLGLRISLIKLGKRLLNRFDRAAGTKSVGTELNLAQDLIEAAARAYRPEKYEGKVLLLLASDGPSRENFLPGWQAVVPNLHTEYVDGRHEDLMNEENVRSVADAIVSRLASTTCEMSLFCGPNISPAPVQPANSSRIGLLRETTLRIS